MTKSSSGHSPSLAVRMSRWGESLSCSPSCSAELGRTETTKETMEKKKSSRKKTPSLAP